MNDASGQTPTNVTDHLRFQSYVLLFLLPCLNQREPHRLRACSRRLRYGPDNVLIVRSYFDRLRKVQNCVVVVACVRLLHVNLRGTPATAARSQTRNNFAYRALISSLAACTAAGSALSNFRLDIGVCPARSLMSAWNERWANSSTSIC